MLIIMVLNSISIIIIIDLTFIYFSTVLKNFTVFVTNILNLHFKFLYIMALNDI